MHPSGRRSGFQILATIDSCFAQGRLGPGISGAQIRAFPGQHRAETFSELATQIDDLTNAELSTISDLKCRRFDTLGWSPKLRQRFN